MDILKVINISEGMVVNMTNLEISLKEDLLFKKIFSNQEVLEDLINSFLDVIDIKERFYAVKCEAEASILPNTKDKKVFAGDVVATLNNGDIICTEMYKHKYGMHEHKKTICYLTRLYSNQINTGNTKYENIHKVIGIVFMQGNFSRLNNDLINIYKLVKIPDIKVIKDGDISYYLVRLDLQDKIYYNKGEETRFNKWIRFMNATSIPELEKIGKDDEIMENSIRVVQEWYKETSKNALKDALAEERYYGERDGEKRGEARGKKLGKKLGIEQTRFETAKKLLKRDMPIEDIADITKLSKKEILSLIN